MLPPRRMNEFVPKAFVTLSRENDNHLYKYFYECYLEWTHIKLEQGWKPSIYLTQEEYEDLKKFLRDRFENTTSNIVEQLADQDWESLGIEHHIEQEKIDAHRENRRPQ